MANRLLSFAGGLAQGYMNQSRYQDQQARQEKLDAMREQEFELRKRQLEGQIGDQDQERSDRQALRNDVKTEAPVEGAAVSVGGELSGNTDAESAANSVQAIEVANQTLPADQQLSAGVTPIRTVGRGDKQKTFLPTPQGLADAEQYTKTLNDPGTQVKKYTDSLRSQGKVAEALKFESDHAEQQQKLHQAQINAVTNHGLELISQGDFGGLAKAYNEHYQDGRTAVFQPGAEGGEFAIYQGDPKDGKRLGTMPFQSKEALAQQFYEMMNPLEAMKSRQAREQKLAEERAKSITDRDKFLWQEGVKAEFRGQTVGGVGGSGSKKAPATPLDNALGAIDDNYKSDMDPDAISRARDLVTRSFQLDPSIDPQQRALAAKSAISNKSTVSPHLVFGEKAGMAATHIDPTTGAKTPLHALPTQYAVTDADKAGFQADVKAFVAKENQTNPGFGDLMYQAAKGDKSAVAALPSFAAGRIKERLLAANPLPANLTAAQKVQALAALDARVQAALPKVMASIQPSLALIRTYGQ